MKQLKTEKKAYQIHSLRRITSLFVIGLLLPVGCIQRGGDSASVTKEADSLLIQQRREAREDSLELAQARKAQANFAHKLQAAVETDPVASLEGEDAADDPAIWVNERHPERSLILGTNKTGGLNVYDLSGKELQERSIGNANNVDLRDGFSLNGKEVTLVATSNRSINAVSLLTLDPATGILSDTLLNIPSLVDEVYGLCLFRDSKTNAYFVFVNGKDGNVEQWLIRDTGGLSGELVRTFSVNSQPEGMVADDQHRLLYIGVEEEGIYVTGAGGSEPAGLKFIPGSGRMNDAIEFDIEGLSIFSHNGHQYLLASSQGNFSYALFAIGETTAYLASFVISDGMIDGAEETDGLDITTASLPAPFNDGLLVVQDGYNVDGEQAKNQNFKLVPMTGVRELLDRIQMAD